MSEIKSGDYDEWIAYGHEKGWCSKIVCVTHTWVPMGSSEEEQFIDGFDPCIFAVRIYENNSQAEMARENSNDG